MPGDACIVCGNTRKKAPQLSYHRFPSDPERRALWLQAFQLTEEQIRPHSRVCSRHFPDGNPLNKPDLSLGKRFASPVKKGAPRTKRAKLREQAKELEALSAQSSSQSRSVTPLLNASTSSYVSSSDSLPPPSESPLTACIGEQLDLDYQVHELPQDIDETSSKKTTPQPRSIATEDENLVNAALMARIEFLEAENVTLKKCLSGKEGSQTVHLGINSIKHDDSLISFYTGFSSYAIFLAFFQFLGPAVNKLHCWGMSSGTRKRHRSTKLAPIDQLLMTLVKLRLNLKVKDLAFRFGVSPAGVSRYITTWICFLYHYFKAKDKERGNPGMKWF